MNISDEYLLQFYSRMETFYNSLTEDVMPYQSEPLDYFKALVEKLNYHLITFLNRRPLTVALTNESNKISFISKYNASSRKTENHTTNSSCHIIIEDESPPHDNQFTVTTAISTCSTLTGVKLSWINHPNISLTLLSKETSTCSTSIDKWKWLCLNTTCLKSLSSAFLWLNTLTLREVYYKTEHFLDLNIYNLDDHFKKIKHQLQQISRTNEVIFLEASYVICLRLYHHLLNRGWLIEVLEEPIQHNKQTTRPKQKTELLELINQIEQMANHPKKHHDNQTQSDTITNKRNKLKNILTSLRILARSSEFSHTHSVSSRQPELVHLMFLWTTTHQQLRQAQKCGSFSFDAVKPLQNEEWTKLALKSQTTSRSFLKDATTEVFKQDALCKDASSSKNFINWLHLWFCDHLLELSLAPTHWHADQMAFRTDLAYFLRETLRSIEFGDRDDVSTEPITFTSALRNLVIYHIHNHPDCDLPLEFDLKRHFHDLERVWGNGDYERPLNYLNHVLDVYILGWFLLHITLPPRSENQALPTSVLDVVSSVGGLTPAADAKKEFLRSFGLAILFHDISQLVFPFEDGGDPYTNHVIRGPATHVIGDIQQVLQQAWSGISRRCIEDLSHHAYFDRSQERDLDTWLAEQTNGLPNHGLLSAWYLHHVCQSQSAAGTTVLKSAVRAILLHNALSVPLRTDSDSQAAFVVLCNELLDWKMSGLGFPILSPNHFSTMIAAPMLQGENRFVNISLFNLKATLEADTAGQGQSHQVPQLRFTLDHPIEPKKSHPWHRLNFLVRLQNPSALNVPTFALWLAKSQTLGRIIPGEQSWGTSVRLANQLPPASIQAGHSNLTVLKMLAQQSKLPIRPQLLEWLELLHDIKKKSTTTATTLESQNLPVYTCDQNCESLCILNWSAMADLAGYDRIYHDTRHKNIYLQNIQHWIPNLSWEVSDLLSRLPALPFLVSNRNHQATQHRRYPIRGSRLIHKVLDRLKHRSHKRGVQTHPRPNTNR